MKKLIVKFEKLPGVELRIFGQAQARTLAERMAQAFYVVRGTQAIARCDQTQQERETVLAYLQANYPQHAALIKG